MIVGLRSFSPGESTNRTYSIVPFLQDGNPFDGHANPVATKTKILMYGTQRKIGLDSKFWKSWPNLFSWPKFEVYYFMMNTLYSLFKRIQLWICESEPLLLHVYWAKTHFGYIPTMNTAIFNTKIIFIFDLQIKDTNVFQNKQSMSKYKKALNLPE